MTPTAETICATLARDAGQPDYRATLRQVILWTTTELARVNDLLPLLPGCGKSDGTPYGDEQRD